MQLLLPTALLATGVLGLYEPRDAVKLSTAATFDKDVLSSPLMSIVEFFAPWCGHCQQTAPAYKEVAKKLNGLVNVVAVDCDEESNKVLCAKYEVKGFPTFKTFRPNKKRKAGHDVDDYNGQRTAKDMINHLTYLLPNRAKMIRNDNFEAFLAETDPAAPPKVMLYTKKTKIPSIIKVVSSLFPSLDFGVVNEKENEVVKRFNIPEFPMLVLTRGGGRRRTEKFLGQMNVAEISEWLAGFAPEDVGQDTAHPEPVTPTSIVIVKNIEDEADFTETCLNGAKPCFAIPKGVRLGRYETQFDKYTLVSVAPEVARKVEVDTNTFVINGAKGWVLPAKKDLETLEEVLAFRDDVKLGQGGKKRRWASQEAKGESEESAQAIKVEEAAQDVVKDEL